MPDEEIIASLYNVEQEVPLTENHDDERQVTNSKAIFGNDVIDTSMSVTPKKNVNGYTTLHTEDEWKDKAEAQNGNSKFVSKSAEDLAYHKLPALDIEMKLMKGHTSAEFITLENVDDTRILKLKAESVEYVIKPDGQSHNKS